MPGKMARSDPRLSVRVTRGAGSGPTSRLSCKSAGKTRTLMPVWDSSGESRLRPDPECYSARQQRAAGGGFQRDRNRAACAFRASDRALIDLLFARTCSAFETLVSEVHQHGTASESSWREQKDFSTDAVAE